MKFANFLPEIYPDNFVPKLFEKGRFLLDTSLKLLNLSSKPTHAECMRRVSRTTTPVTLYGVAHHVDATGHQLSVSGLNNKCLNGDGNLSPTDVMSWITESLDMSYLNRPRVNKLVNDFTLNRYESYIYLMFTMLGEYHTQRAIEGTTTYDVDYELTHAQCISIATTRNEDEKIAKVQSYTVDLGPNKCGYSSTDTRFETWLERIEEHAVLVPEAEAEIPSIKLRAKVWCVDEYDDGHYKIKESRFGKAGFKNGKYLVPENVSTVILDGPPDFKSHKLPEEKEQLDDYLKFGNVYRLNNFSAQEVLLFHYIITVLSRRTPFLSDQADSSSLKHEYQVLSDSVRLRDVQDCEIFCYSSGDILCLINKFLINHRCFDDLLVASRLYDSLVCQPEPDTLEGHVWFNVPRRYSLPMPGAWRGIHAYFVSGVPFNIDPEALAVSRDLRNILDLKYINSMIYNAAWQHAEFLKIYSGNTGDIEALAEAMENGVTSIHSDVSVDVPAKVSAVLGKMVPTYIYPGIGVRLTDALPKFGKNIMLATDGEIPRDCPWARDATNPRAVLVEQVPPPSGTVIILGCAGPLLKDTPLDANFTLKPVAKQRTGKKLGRYTDWLNLWCLGMVSRWQGYDLYYNALDEGRIKRKLWAPNGSNLCQPPVVAHNIDDPRQYKILEELEREHVFGDGGWFNTKEEVTMNWSRKRVAMYTGKTIYDGEEVCNLTSPVALPKLVGFSESGTQRYNLAVMVAQEPGRQDFQVDLLPLNRLYPANIELAPDAEIAREAEVERPDENLDE